MGSLQVNHLVGTFGSGRDTWIRAGPEHLQAKSGMMGRMTSPLLLAAELTLVAVCVLMLSISAQRRPVLLALIGFAAALELQVGGVHAATALTLLLVVMTRPAMGVWDRSRIPSAVVATSALLASTVLFGDLVNRPILGVQLMALALTAAVLVLWCDASEVPQLLKGVLTGATLGSAIAMLQNVRLVPATYFLDSTGFARVHSIYREPDFLAVFAAVGVILAFRLVHRRWLQVILIAVNSAALTYTFARAAALALVVSAVVTTGLSLLSRGGVRRRRNGGLVILLACLLFGGMAVDPSLGATMETRFTGALRGADISVQARQRQVAGLAALSDTAPWYGHGLSAGGRVTGFGAYDSGQAANNVASNWLLGWWVDGRWVALPLILTLIAIALATSRTIGGQLLVFALVNSLFSNVLFFPVTWIALAAAVLAAGGDNLVRGELEPIHAVRLDLEGLRDPPDRGLGQPRTLGHRRPRPVRGILRRLLRRGDHDRLHLIDADRGRPLGPGLVQ